MLFEMQVNRQAFASEVVGTDFKMQTIIDGAIESLFIEA